MNLNDIKKIDFKKIINIVKNNFDKDAGLFLLVLVLIIFFGVKQFVQPTISKLNENFNKVSQKKEELKQYEIREKFMSSPDSQKTKQNLPINIYKAPYEGMDTESASVELVQQIIKIIKETGNSRINQVDFTTQELKDDAGTNSSDYGVLSLNLSIEGPYESLQNALNEIYLMKYLIVIKKIESNPLDSLNYDFIKTDLTLDLYIKLNNFANNSQNGMPPEGMRSLGGPTSGMPQEGAPTSGMPQAGSRSPEIPPNPMPSPEGSAPPAPPGDM